MEIRRVNNGVEFWYGDERTFTEGFRQIKSILVRQDGATDTKGVKHYALYVNCSHHDNWKIFYDQYDFPTYPNFSSPENLKDIILLWNSEELETNNYVAGVAQTNFVTSFILQQNVNFYVGGVLQSPTNYTWTVGTSTLVWTGAAFAGGESIIIQTW